MRFFTLALLGAVAAVKLEQTHNVEDALLIQLDAPCNYLDETQKELDYQLEMFSRTFDARHWTNANNVAAAMSKAGKTPKWHISTWELYNNAFSFPRVRRYSYVQENMDALEHFQDNLNLNITNSAARENFVRTAQAVRDSLNERYQDGEFNDPANYDPRTDAASTYFKTGNPHPMPAAK